MEQIGSSLVGDDTFADYGVGITINVDRKEGLGTSIIFSLAQQMRALVYTETSSDGTTVTFT